MRLLDESGPVEPLDHHQQEEGVGDHLCPWVVAVEAFHQLVGEGEGLVEGVRQLEEEEVLSTWEGEEVAWLLLREEEVEGHHEMGEVVVELLLPWLEVVVGPLVKGEGEVEVLGTGLWKGLEVLKTKSQKSFSI